MSTKSPGVLPERLVEITLIVRPEEKAAVERALESVAPPIHTTFPALGRGAQGGLSYRAAGVASKFLEIFRTNHAVFLPKVVFQIVLPESHVDRVFESCSAALALVGGPVDSGLGIGIVTPIGKEVVIGQPRRKAEAVEKQTRVDRELSASGAIH